MDIFKLLNRIENDSNKAIVKWVSSLNVSLMNWARVGKAIIQARVHSENDEYGKAIGLIDNWESSFTNLKEYPTYFDISSVRNGRLFSNFNTKNATSDTTSHHSGIIIFSSSILYEANIQTIA